MSFGDGGRGQPSGTRRPVDGIAVLLVTMTAAASTSYRAGQGRKLARVRRIMIERLQRPRGFQRPSRSC
jgi:hypothetical protein